MDPAKDPPDLHRSVRIRILPSATRRCGPDLLVNAGGATAPVQRIGGAGPDLWNAFSEEMTIAEASAAIARLHDINPAEIEQLVQSFAKMLIGAGLATAT